MQVTVSAVTHNVYLNKSTWDSNGSYALQGLTSTSDGYGGFIGLIDLSFTKTVDGTPVPVDISGSTITAASLTFSFAGYGRNATKNLKFFSSNYNDFDKTRKGSAYIGNAMGTFSATAYNTTAVLTGEVLEALKAEIQAGRKMVCLKSNDTALYGTKNYSSNYLAVTNVTGTIICEESNVIVNGNKYNVYVNGVKHTPWININGVWKHT